MEHQAPARGRSVERFLQGPEPDAAAAQVSDDRDEILEGSGEPVEGGDDEGVAGPQIVQRLSELGAVGALARSLVGEDPDAVGLGQLCGLLVEPLIPGRGHSRRARWW